MLIRHCIIIDDDLWTVLFHKRLINTIAPTVNTIQFVDADKGFDHIQENYPLHPGTSRINTIVLLDLDMPNLTGQGFIGRFMTLPQEVRNEISIIIVTGNEKYLAGLESVVHISKPLTADSLKDLLK